MNLFPRAFSTLRLMEFRLRRSLSLASLIALLCLIATPALAVTYTDNRDGTVTDPTTGLTWMRCSVGQSWTGTTCSGTANGYTWNNANVTPGTFTFAGNSDWRLPNIRELQTLINRSMRAGFSPIDNTAFPNSPSIGFWSSTPDASDPWGFNALGISSGNFTDYTYHSNGQSISTSKDFSAAVRLVRGGQTSDFFKIARPTSDYVDNGDGTVTHVPTRLMWKRCSEGQVWWSGGDCTSVASTAAQVNVANLSNSTFAGKSDWRLPTAEELLTLVDYTLYGPAINLTIFPSTPSTPFYSSSFVINYDILDGYHNTSWTVDFQLGLAKSSNGAYASQDATITSLPKWGVRLVRSSGSGSSAISDTDCLFSWAEKTLPSYFSPPNQSSQTSNGITYRYYPTTATYLGFLNRRIMVLGGVFGGTVTDVGSIDGYIQTARTANCR